MNGAESHPLFRYLKKNCAEFYNYDTKSAQKKISSPVGLFIVENSTDADKTVVSYYNEENMAKFIEKQKSV